MPNFLVIGAIKAGTTSLYQYLKQHPQIYLSPLKETNFFAFEGETIDFGGPGFQESYTKCFSITNIEDYQLQFQEVSNEIAIGEVSPIYLYCTPKAPKKIKQYIPDTKLIVILRNPCDRAFSHFLHMMRDEREPLEDFAKALKEEDKRIEKNWGPAWHYQKIGFYYESLKLYFDLFDRDRLKIYLFEDFQTQPIQILQDIFSFLEVDKNFVPDMSKIFNSSYVRKSKFIDYLIMKPNTIKAVTKLLIPSQVRQQFARKLNQKNKVKPKLSEELREQLIELYREDILNLQDLIQKDLSKWLEIN